MRGANEDDPRNFGTRMAPQPAAMIAMIGCLVGTACCLTLADDETASPTQQPFEAGDISIGEPISLPFSPPAAAVQPAAEHDAADEWPVAAPPATAAPAATIPGNGWLGLVVAESAVPGRWMVVEVAEQGPAAGAGVLVGDEVRAINGLPLRSSDEVAQVLTAIAAGQTVRVAVARGEQRGALTLLAIARPAAARTSAGPAATAEPAGVSSWAAATQPQARPEPDRSASFDSSVGGDQPLLPTAVAPAVPTAGSRFARQRPQAAEPPPDELPAPVATAAPARGRTALGVRTVPIDAEIQERFRLPQASGAYVIGVVGDLPASKAGVPPGSVIVALGDRPVRSPTELTRLVTDGPVGRPVSLEYVLPGGTPQRADVVLQALEQPLEAALIGPPVPAASAVPTLQSQPTATVAQRPAGPGSEPTLPRLEAELLRLRARVETLERQLRAASR